MSVDTYAQKASYRGYQKFRREGVEILINSNLLARASRVRLDLKKFLFYKWLAVNAELLGHEA